jgi:hypothetical protein
MNDRPVLTRDLLVLFALTGGVLFAHCRSPISAATSWCRWA